MPRMTGKFQRNAYLDLCFYFVTTTWEESWLFNPLWSADFFLAGYYTQRLEARKFADQCRRAHQTHRFWAVYIWYCWKWHKHWWRHIGQLVSLIGCPNLWARYQDIKLNCPLWKQQAFGKHSYVCYHASGRSPLNNIKFLEEIILWERFSDCMFACNYSSSFWSVSFLTANSRPRTHLVIYWALSSQFTNGYALHLCVQGFEGGFCE